MDFLSFMAGFALLAFWANTLLIAAAGVGECAALRRRYDLAFGTGLQRATIVTGAGEGQALAVWRARQVGRSNGVGPILFHDRARVSEACGGALRLADGGSLALPAGAAVEVWIAGPRKREAARCFDPAMFAAAAPAATRAAGWERSVELRLVAGEAIWVGRGEGAPGPARTGAGGVAPIVLADADPRGWRARITGLTAALVVGLVAVAGLCTLLCLWPPAFGAVSKLGAFAAVVAFNLFQLLGKLHHDAIQPPHSATLDGAWRRP